MSVREVGAFEAKTHLSRLLDAVEAGETVVITRRGRPVARLTPPEGAGPRRLGFLAARIPDDFDRMDAETIAEDFEG